VDIQFGEGGDDSKLFVEDLYEAYVRWAQINNLESEELHRGDGKISVKFTGKGATKAFKHEAGKHCVQRVPPTESKGRRHTSFISVAVMPLLHTDFYINEKDIEIKTQGGHGKGGQHQNKTDSAVRATHTPTGLKVFINGRSQHANKKLALEILANKVQQYYTDQKVASHNEKKRNQMGGGHRSGKIRTYNFIESVVRDHQLNTKTGKIKQIMKGHFDLLLKE